MKKKMIEEFINEFKIEIQNIKEQKSLKKQIPNILTISRAISPLIVLGFVLSSNPIGALISAGLFASTDFFDGFIAKKFNCTSKLGVVLDQICDKIMAIGISFVFIPFNPIISVNIISEGIISTIAVNSKRKGNINKSGIIGRIKTWFLSLSIIASYVCPMFNLSPYIFYTLFGLSFIGQIATAIDYYATDKKMDISKIEPKVETINVIDLVDEESKEISFAKTMQMPYHEIPEYTTEHVKKLEKK